MKQIIDMQDILLEIDNYTSLTELTSFGQEIVIRQIVIYVFMAMIIIMCASVCLTVIVKYIYMSL